MSVTKVPTMHPEHHPHDALYLDKHGADGVHIGVNGDRRIFEAGVIVNRADFIAAVETECDGIFIPRAELPEVKEEVPGFGPHYVLVKEGPIHESSFTYAYPNAPASSASWHRRTAEAHLALAEYLDAHPPVDPAEVEALAHLICEHEQETTPAIEVARRLLATGRVQVTL